MLAVPLLKHFGSGQKAAHANSVAVILPLCAASTVLYSISGKVDFISALYFIPAGIAGAFLGSYLLKKIPDIWLKRIFALFMLWAGMRLVLK